MKRVGVREFRDHASCYLGGEDSLEIERHGELIGIYIPLKSRPRKDVAEAMARLERTIREVTARTGLSEDELSRLFDIREPLPDIPSTSDDEGIVPERASRR